MQKKKQKKNFKIAKIHMQKKAENNISKNMQKKSRNAKKAAKKSRGVYVPKNRTYFLETSHTTYSMFHSMPMFHCWRLSMGHST